MRNKHTARAIRKLVLQRLALTTISIVISSIAVGSYAFALYLGDSLADTQPWSFIQYRYAFSVGDPYRSAWLISGIAPAFILMMVALAIVVTPHQSGEHGDARWASAWEQAKSGLRNRRGLILGRVFGAVLRANLNTHVAMIAPTRSGKGLGVVIPNSLNWYGSAIFTDIKFELWELTSGFRSTFSECLLFAPGRKKTMRYNPFDLVSLDSAARIGDLHKIAHIIVPTPEKADPMWASEARSLFVATVLYLMDTPGSVVSLGAVHRFINAQDWSNDGISQLLSGHTDLDGLTQDTFTRMSGQGEKQRAGVTSSVMTALEVYLDPYIDAATSASDFDIRDIRRKRMSIYLGVKEGEKQRLAPLFNLLIQQLTSELVDDIKVAETGLPVMMMLDEFPALGRMDTVINALGFFAGYNVRVLMIAQNFHQLKRVCDDPNELLSAFRHTVYYAPALHDDAVKISEMLGQKTITNESTSHSVGGATKTRSKIGRPLMSPDQIFRLGPRKAIITQSNERPVLAWKYNYLHHRSLRRLTKMMPVDTPELMIMSADETRLWREPLDDDFDVVDNDIQARFAA